MSSVFPFTAIVGQEVMKQALILNAINPLIGGVLIRGEKGTAKSTLARGLAELLPDIPVVEGCPFHCDPALPFPGCPHCSSLQERGVTMRQMPVVTLPANATEDRVAGTLDIEHALAHGSRRFEPGVLAQAHRGILYIDEVNLLDDHLVDLLLDAAAMGVNTVEREGISFSHPSQFILIGTMNPEEGDLRPQLLDRFSLCVDATAIMDSRSRVEIIRRRIAWEKDPEQFSKSFADQQQKLRDAIVSARNLLPQVRIEDARLHEAAQICSELEVRSHRADIVMVRTALTIAAYEGRTEVSQDDIRQAARLCLPHRMRRHPFEESRLDPEKIDQALQKPDQQQQESTDTRNQTLTQLPQEQIFAIGQVPDLALPTPTQRRSHQRGGGKRDPATAQSPRGRYTRATQPSGPVTGNNIAVDATLRAAAVEHPERQAGKILQVRPNHLRVKKRTQPLGTMILFVVDASGSMAAARRMEAAKGAVLSLLRDAYVKRNRVALIAFRDTTAEVLLPPTDNVDLAHEQLKTLPTGGRTPLAHGLAKALDLAHQIRQSHPGTRLLIVLISDGKANVSYDPSSQATPFDEAVAFARQLVLRGAEVMVLDTEDDFLSLGMAAQLAQTAGAAHIKLSSIEAAAIERTVRDQLH